MSKFVMIIIFVKFIDQLIDYPINCASLSVDPDQMPQFVAYDLCLQCLPLIQQF